jgi:hypothetical protein
MSIFSSEYFETKHQKKLFEQFFDYYNGNTYYNMVVNMFIYKNPTKDEWIKFIAINSRGYISSKGDIYMEGYDSPSNDTSVIHTDLLKVLAKYNICSMDYAVKYFTNTHLLYDLKNNGLIIQREGITNKLELSESYSMAGLRNRKQEQYLEFFKTKVTENCPYLTLLFKTHRVTTF